MAISPEKMDELFEKLRIPETTKSDNVLKWDGKQLYVTDQFYRGKNLRRTVVRDVTAEVAACVGKLLSGKAKD
jgi:hypothetical protein